MWTHAVEKRTRLPIFLLVASGYFLGVVLPISWNWLFWLRRKITGWGVLLLFALAFYDGRDRFRALLSELDLGEPVKLTTADRWFEMLRRICSAAVGIGFCGLLGGAAGFMVSEMGANRYVSIGVGLVAFWGIAGNVFGKERLGVVDQY